MVQYRFRLTGVPPDQAIKLIECDPNQSVAEIKKSVQREYKLNPILAIQFIYKGKVLPDNIKFARPEWMNINYYDLILAPSCLHWTSCIL